MYIRRRYLIALSASLLHRDSLLDVLGDSVAAVDGGVSGEGIGLKVGAVVVVGDLGGDGLLNSVEGLVEGGDGPSLRGLSGGLGGLGAEGSTVVGGSGNINGFGVETRVLVRGDVLDVALLNGKADSARSAGPAIDLLHEAGVVLDKLPNESIRALNHFVFIYFQTKIQRTARRARGKRGGITSVRKLQQIFLFRESDASQQIGANSDEISQTAQRGSGGQYKRQKADVASRMNQLAEHRPRRNRHGVLLSL